MSGDETIPTPALSHNLGEVPFPRLQDQVEMGRPRLNVATRTCVHRLHAGELESGMAG